MTTAITTALGVLLAAGGVGAFGGIDDDGGKGLFDELHEQQRATLAGVANVEVIVITTPPVDQQKTIERVTSRLDAAGVTVVKDRHETGVGLLFVGTRCGSDSLCDVQVTLRQDAVLARDTSIATIADTWRRAVSERKPAEVDEKIDRFLEQFIADWHEANPKKPASPGASPKP